MPDISPAEDLLRRERERAWVWLPLAHHRRRDLDRCVLLPLGQRRLALCARCLALYPLLLGTILLQALFRPPLLGQWDWVFIFGASVPALLDWGLAWIGLRRGSTASRMVSGALLGAALGRSFWLYFQDPLNELFWSQVLLLVVVAAALELLRQRRLRD